MITQNNAPILEALQRHSKKKVIPFHVPGHKYGRGLKELRKILGKTTLRYDLNAMPSIDDLGSPKSAIKEAQYLAAELFQSDFCHFLINGSTSGVQTMMLATLNPHDEVIIPRNSHKSTFNGLILSGAMPIYAEAEYQKEQHLQTVVPISTMKNLILKHKQAKSILLLNPSYYGMSTDLKQIIDLAHKHNQCVLVDEAHGCHFYFHDELQNGAMQLNADMSVISTHKTGGSLTQSSILLLKGQNIHMNSEWVLKVLNLLRSTSASYLLMLSIDIARRQLALHGNKMIQKILDLSRYLRNEINKLGFLYAYGKEIINNQSIFGFDETKLAIDVHKLGITGYTVEKILREQYHIEIEFSDQRYIFIVISLGDSFKQGKQLLKALTALPKYIANHNLASTMISIQHIPSIPKMILTPRDAWYKEKEVVTLNNSLNHISGEMIMAYPPGIPLVCPGERITQEIIEYIKLLKRNQYNLQGTIDPMVNYLRIIRK